jgi:uncharacterized protein (DUF302 family)
MAYYFNNTLSVTFEEAVARTIEALKAEGFGVLTQIDVKMTLKEKIGAEFRNYRILGACNPQLAHEALKLEDKIGTMLPCKRGRPARQADGLCSHRPCGVDASDRQPQA